MYRGKRAGHRAPVTGTPDADLRGQASATGLCTWRARSSPAARGRLGLAGQQPRARDPIRATLGLVTYLEPLSDWGWAVCLYLPR